MKDQKRILALLLSGAMALSLFACGSTPQATNGDPSAAPSVELPTEPDASASPAIVADLTMGALEFSAGASPTDTMLTVNGQEIPADLVLYMLTMNCINMQYYLPYFDMTLADVADTLLEESVAMTVYHVLIRQKAAELGCLLTDAQTEELRLAMEEADLESNAPYWGLTDDSAEFIFAMDAYYNNVLDAVTHEPSEEELEDYMTAQGLYRVKHILIKTVDDGMQPLPDGEIAEKRAQAEALLAELQGAEDLPALFDQRMNELSEDGRDASTGGLYAPDGYLASPGQMDSSFEAASLALAEGGMSELVESAYGYHIILRLPLTPFTDEEKADYQSAYRPNVLEDIIAQWQEEASIDRSDALSSLDVAAFYDRLAAYQQALAEQRASAEDGVG